MWSSFRRRRAQRPRPVAATRASGSSLVAITVGALALAFGSACTEVHVEETVVAWNTPVCGSNNGGRNGGGSAQPSGAVMDTYMVQIFELYDPTVQVGGKECETCVTGGSNNCFIESSLCTCGEPTSVDSEHMQQMLKGVRVGLPESYRSQYCLRVMAVERTTQPDSGRCECDSAWIQPDRVRLCALSTPYAASSVPISMSVQCSLNADKFSACVGQ